MRNLVVLFGLAAAAGLAYAALRPQQPAGAVDLPEGEGDGAWSDPLFDAASDAADSLQGIMMGQQTLSYAGLQQLQQFEGFSATPYPDHKGYSIGYGHLIKPGEDLEYVDQGQAQVLLLADIGWAERAVRTAVSVPLTQNQFDALVSFAYNVGEGAFKRSTLVKLLNAGDVAGAAAEFPRWVYASGQVNASLQARRDRERSLFEA